MNLKQGGQSPLTQLKKNNLQGYPQRMRLQRRLYEHVWSVFLLSGFLVSQIWLISEINPS